MLVLMIRSFFVDDSVSLSFYKLYAVSTPTASIKLELAYVVDRQLARSQTGVVTYSEVEQNPLRNSGSRFSYHRYAAERKGFWFHLIHIDDAVKLTLPPWKPGTRSASFGRTHRIWVLFIPDWVILICAAALCWHCARRYKNERLPGYCDACGYDLRATPDRCPECGTLPLKKEIIST
jgi:hypothetical protein